MKFHTSVTQAWHTLVTLLSFHTTMRRLSLLKLKHLRTAPIRPSAGRTSRPQWNERGNRKQLSELNWITQTLRTIETCLRIRIIGIKQLQWLFLSSFRTLWTQSFPTETEIWGLAAGWDGERLVELITSALHQPAAGGSFSERHWEHWERTLQWIRRHFTSLHVYIFHFKNFYQCDWEAQSVCQFTALHWWCNLFITAHLRFML